MNARRILAPVLLAALLLPALVMGTARPAAAGHLRTGAAASTTAALNLRGGPSTDFAVLRVIRQGERVQVVAGPERGHWYLVTYAGSEGYVSGDYLAQGRLSIAIEPEAGPPGTAVTITGSGAEPGEEIVVAFAYWPLRIDCRAGRGTEPLATVTADAAGRFRATHVAELVRANLAGITYLAARPGQGAGGTSNLACFEFTDVPRSRFFPETGFAASGAFLDYWREHGGLATFGYPLTAIFDEERPLDGKVYTVQYFERARFELHPADDPPYYAVRLGLLGHEALPGEAFPRPPVAPVREPDCAHFEATGHNVCGRFLAYWEANGGLPIFGYPLGEAYQARLADGREHLVQYFERARFEWHPEQAPPHDVLLGQLGREVVDGRYGEQFRPGAP